MLTDRPTIHEGKIKCPFCREWIDSGFVDSRCPNCHKKLKKKCVICGSDFVVKDSSGYAQFCDNPECYKKFRYHCGIGDRYWRTEAQKKQDKYH